MSANAGCGDQGPKLFHNDGESGASEKGIRNWLNYGKSFLDIPKFSSSVSRT
jgi:hypothetical protein